MNKFLTNGSEQNFCYKGNPHIPELYFQYSIRPKTREALLLNC